MRDERRETASFYPSPTPAAFNSGPPGPFREILLQPFLQSNQQVRCLGPRVGFMLVLCAALHAKTTFLEEIEHWRDTYLLVLKQSHGPQHLTLPTRV